MILKLGIFLVVLGIIKLGIAFILRKKENE